RLPEARLSCERSLPRSGRGSSEIPRRDLARRRTASEPARPAVATDSPPCYCRRMPHLDPVYAPMATPEELRPDSEADAHVSTIQREGFVVLEHVLSPLEVDAMRAALAPYLQGKHMGRNDFEGFHTERVYALLAKDPALALLVEHPRLLSIVDRL